MVILIDAGNSRVKWAWLDAGELGESTAIAYKNNDKVEVLKALLEENKPTKISLVHVLGDEFEQEVHDYCKKSQCEYTIFKTTASCCGVTNGYDVPEQLGADRFVALIGAHHLYPNDNLLVIDVGTAVTIDGISEKGRHAGGLILPGLQLWSDTLIKNTKRNTQLSPLYSSRSIEADTEVFATNTQRGINSGSILGLSGAINHICHIMENSMEDKMTSELKLSTNPCVNKTKRLLCGGDSYLLADTLADDVSEEYILTPDLVMHGLMIIEQSIIEKNNA